MTNRVRQFDLASEAPWCEAEPPWQWPIADMLPFAHIPVTIGLTDDKIGSLVASLCDPLELEPQSDTQLILGELANLDSYSLRGGLRITSGDDVIVSHGCCSGLEDWRELFSICERQTPWMGHDPDPWCEFLDDETVRFWASGATSNTGVEPHIDFSLRQVSEELSAFQGALERTMRRLHDWLTVAGTPHVDKIVDTFGQSFAITRDSPLYKTQD